MKNYFLIALNILIIQVITALCGTIQGWDLEKIQGYDGSTQGYKLYISLDSGLGPQDFIQIVFPRDLGTNVQASLYLYQNNMLIADQRDYSNKIVEAAPFQNSFNYYFQIGYQLQPQIWYTLVLTSIAQPPLQTLYQDPIMLQTVSDSCSSGGSCTPIIYDMNHSFALLYDTLPQNLPNPNINVSFQAINNYNLLPGSSYYTFIDITPTVSDPLGATYYISIEQSASNLGLGIDQDFKFKGACYSDVVNCNSNSLPSCISISQVQSSTCLIDKLFAKLTFNINQALVQGQTFRIKVELENPIYQSQRDINVYAVGKTSSNTIEKGTSINALKTQLINISHSQFTYLWGIPDNQPFLSGDIPYSLFRSGANLFTMNSVKVSFTVDQTIPMGQEFAVTVCFGQATDILTNSIVTNLPRLDLNKNPSCYTSINPAINSCVICEQVGALAYSNYNYFIAAKVYYSSSTQLTITSFGSVSIVLKNQLSALLYNSYQGETVQLQANTEYLDLNGFHSNQFGMGYTQIVSVPDNQSLSGTADGIGQFLSSSKKNTVGIIPDSSQSQQLLFFLQVPQANYAGLSSNPGNSVYNFRMSVMFNPNVLTYQQGFDQFGIDFAAFQLGTPTVPNQWNVNQVSCYATNTCTWYNQNGQNKPINNLEQSPSSASAVYSIQRFDCITSNFADCYNWKGFNSATSGSSGAFSMRRVQFKSGFQSQIQPDDQLLDFVIAFQRGLITGSSQVQYLLVTAQLVNAYTISFSQLQNAKISFVNFSDKTLNPGHKIPTFLRIGGSILPSENLQATAIAIFFDQSIEVNWFYDEQGTQGRQTNKKIGCSAGDCYLYDAKIVNGQETWMNNVMVLATNIMNIENEFNLLIPVQNVMSGSTVSFPTRLNIAFCNFSRTSLGVRNQLNVLSIYRVYGATVNGVITQPITPINGLNLNLFPNTLSFSSSTWQADTGYLAKYTLQTSSMQPFGSTNTLFAADSSTTFPGSTFNSQYKGAGVTLCSLHFNVFGPSQLSFAQPPYGVIGSCTNFSYTFNDNSSGNLYTDFNNKRIYCSYCPVDQPYPNLNTAQGNIIWNNPYFNQYFTANFNIQSVFTYAFSSSVGKIYSMYSDNQQVSSLNYNTCLIKNIMNPIYPNSLGKQVVQLSYQVKAQLQLDSLAQIGYGFVQIVFTFSQSISQISFIANSCTLLTQSSVLLTCTLSTTSNSIIFIINPQSTTYLFQVLETVTFQIYAKTNNLLAGIPNLTYQVSVNLPTQKGGNIRIFGLDTTAATNTYSLFAQCQGGSFAFSTMSYSNFMSVGNLKFDIFNVGARSPFNFTIIPQQRERFYSSSYFSIDFGFLRGGNANLVGDNKFRCVVYEAPSTFTQSGISALGSYSISWRWKRIEYNSALKDVRIYPKDDIMQPSNYNFLLQCYGGIVPAPGGVEASEVLQAYWMDGTDTLQKTASPYPYPSQDVISTTNIQSSIITLEKKYWVSNGNEAIYSFKLQNNNFNLDFFSRIYVEFPYFIPPGVNRENNPECYIRVNSVPANSFPPFSDYQLAFCEISGERRVTVWSNKEIQLGSQFYLDIYGVLQPTFYRFNTINPQIWIGFDNDSLLSNGIQEFNYIADQKTPNPTAASTFPLNVFKVTSVKVSNTVIRSTFTLAITFVQDPQQLQSGNFMYLLLTQSLSDMNKLGQSIVCTLFNQADMNTNLAQECNFLSSRLIIIKRNSQAPTFTSSQNNYVLAIENLPTPNYVPPLVKNQIRFMLYNSYGLSNLFDQYVDFMALDYYGGIVSFNSDPNRLNLGWYIYDLVKSTDSTNSNNNVVAQNFESNGVVYVYIGYYKKLVQLQPDKNAFSLNMNITFSGNTQKFSFRPNIFNALSGSNMMQFSMAALQTTPTGIEILNANKIGDPNNVYTPIPALKVIISGQLCQINSRFSTYNIPIGGFSLPIELDFFNCMPVNDITYSPIFNNLSTNNLSIVSQYLVNSVTSSKLDPRMLFVVQEISKDRSKIGNAITLDFKIGGTNGKSYQTPVSISLVLVDPNQSSYSLSPVASQIPNVQIGLNNVTFSMQCSQPSIIFWAVGLNPSLANIDINAMKSKVTGANGLIPNITDTNDQDLKMFGTEIAYSATPLTKVISQLRPNGNYDFKYFCTNQMGQDSIIQTTSWKIPDNGSFLMKLTFSFSSYITFQQQNNIACGLSQYFSIDSTRVITDLSTVCGRYPNYSNLNINNLIVRTSQNGQYLYNFYIQPNYLATTDLTNLSVREKVNSNNFIYSFLNTVTNPQSLPSLTQVITQDVVSVNTPEIAQTGQILTQQTISYTYFTLRSVDGYIIVGLEEGQQSVIPSASQIKQGLNAQNAKLYTFEMRSTRREVQQEFKFIQLHPGTQYTAYFYGSNDDPSSNSITTQPIIITFKTLGDSYSVKTVNSQILKFACTLIALLLVNI